MGPKSLIANSTAASMTGEISFTTEPESSARIWIGSPCPISTLPGAPAAYALPQARAAASAMAAAEVRIPLTKIDM